MRSGKRPFSFLLLFYDEEENGRFVFPGSHMIGARTEPAKTDHVEVEAKRLCWQHREQKLAHLFCTTLVFPSNLPVDERASVFALWYPPPLPRLPQRESTNL